MKDDQVCKLSYPTQMLADVYVDISWASRKYLSDKFSVNIRVLVFTWRHLAYSHRSYLSSMSIHINTNHFLPFRMMSQVIFIIYRSEMTYFGHEWDRELPFGFITWKRLWVSGLDSQKHLCNKTWTYASLHLNNCLIVSIWEGLFVLNE